LITDILLVVLDMGLGEEESAGQRHPMAVRFESVGIAAGSLDTVDEEGCPNKGARELPFVSPGVGVAGLDGLLSVGWLPRGICL
jgi:hypothetical protein